MPQIHGKPALPYADQATNMIGPVDISRGMGKGDTNMAPLSLYVIAGTHAPSNAIASAGAATIQFPEDLAEICL